MSSLRSSLRSMFRCRGDLVDRGEDLEGDVPLDQPRDVDVAAVAAHQQVAAPQQRVGVEVHDEQPLVEGARPLGGVVGRREGRRVQPALGPRDDPPTADAGTGDRGRRDRRRECSPSPAGHVGQPTRQRVGRDADATGYSAAKYSAVQP